jgi:hypothetical protein
MLFIGNGVWLNELVGMDVLFLTELALLLCLQMGSIWSGNKYNV